MILIILMVEVALLDLAQEQAQELVLEVMEVLEQELAQVQALVVLQLMEMEEVQLGQDQAQVLEPAKVEMAEVVLEQALALVLAVQL